MPQPLIWTEDTRSNCVQTSRAWYNRAEQSLDKTLTCTDEASHVTTLLLQFGNWLLLAGITLFVIAVINVLRSSRQARRAAYYGIRQGALNKTRRWAFVATIAFILTGALAFYLDQQPRPTAVANTVTPTPVLISVPSKLLPTYTPLLATATSTIVHPTVLPSPTPTFSPTATLTPTVTPPPDLPDLLKTPIPGGATVSPNAKLTFTTLASIADNKGNPVDPGLAFPGGTRSVRLYFQAAKVNNGAPWSVLCYKGDQLVDSVVDLWQWGSRAQGARAFCSLDGSVGEYKAVAYLGPTQQFEIDFELLPVTPTATTTPQKN